MDWMPQVIREGIFTILFISGPLVILAAILGLAIGIIQAATQIQEQTLASAVKIIGLFLALIIFGFYMFQYMQRYTSENMKRAFRIVSSMGTYIKPRNNFLTQNPNQEGGIQQMPQPAQFEPITVESTGKAPKLAEAIEEPETTEINTDTKPEVIPPPASQAKKSENKNVKKQALAPQVNEPTNEPIVKPAPKLKKKSLSDALTRIRGSIDEFNQQEGVRP